MSIAPRDRDQGTDGSEATGSVVFEVGASIIVHFDRMEVARLNDPAKSGVDSRPSLANADIEQTAERVGEHEDCPRIPGFGGDLFDSPPSGVILHADDYHMPDVSGDFGGWEDRETRRREPIRFALGPDAVVFGQDNAIEPSTDGGRHHLLGRRSAIGGT